MHKINLQTGVDGYPEITQLSEDGFVDLVFSITNLAELATCFHFHLSASYDGAVVGLDVELVKGIQSGFDSQMDLIPNHVYRQGVRFIRSGEESDRLITALSTLRIDTCCK